MKKQGRLITVLILALIVVIFAVLNVEPVAVNFGFAHVKWPLIIIIIVSLLIGAIITFLAATGSSLSQRKGQKQMAKELAALKEQQAEKISQAVAEATAKATQEFEQISAQKDAEIHDLQTKINHISQTSNHHNA